MSILYVLLTVPGVSVEIGCDTLKVLNASPATSKTPVST